MLSFPESGDYDIEESSEDEGNAESVADSSASSEKGDNANPDDEGGQDQQVHGTYRKTISMRCLDPPSLHVGDAFFTDLPAFRGRGQEAVFGSECYR